MVRITITIIQDEYRFLDCDAQLETVPAETFTFTWDWEEEAHDDGDGWECDDVEPETFEEFLTRKLNEKLHLTEYADGVKDWVAIKLNQASKSGTIKIAENRRGSDRWSDRVRYRDYGTFSYVEGA